MRPVTSIIYVKLPPPPRPVLTDGVKPKDFIHSTLGDLALQAFLLLRQ